MYGILGRGWVGWANNRALIYATLFFACALINALGAETIAVLAFLPVAMAVELTAVNGVKRKSSSPLNTVRQE
jgi:ABC-type polysaccharide transport system permease subunit